MCIKVSGKISVILASVFALTTPSSVSAAEIALTFDDHGFTVVGEFFGYDDNAYVVVTDNGQMTVPVELVSCEGQDCIEITDAIAADS